MTYERCDCCRDINIHIFWRDKKTMTGFEATQKKKDDTIYTQRVKIEQAQQEVIELKWKIKEKDAALGGMKANNEKLSQEIAELKAEITAIPAAFKDWRFCCCLCEVLHHLDYLDLRDYFENNLLKAPRITREEMERWESEIRRYY